MRIAAHPKENHVASCSVFRERDLKRMKKAVILRFFLGKPRLEKGQPRTPARGSHFSKQSIARWYVSFCSSLRLFKADSAWEKKRVQIYKRFNQEMSVLMTRRASAWSDTYLLQEHKAHGSHRLCMFTAGNLPRFEKIFFISCEVSKYSPE